MVIAEVEGLLREVAAAVVLPRFRSLAAHEVIEKSPGNLVTVADREAEVMLTRRLLDLRPGSQVIGEEACAADPRLLGHAGDDGELWLVDPVDGTGNFAAGRAPFAMMVALVRDGVTVAGWILDPLTGDMAVAQHGAGAFLNGVRVRLSAEAVPAARLRGPAFVRYAPGRLGAQVVDPGAFAGRVLAGRFCAGYEYPAIARDEQHFVFFWRTLPWDHAAGALLVAEAGGVSRWLDGEEYRVGETRRRGLLVARGDQEWHTLRTTLFSPWPRES